jgi:hypothetical protein
MSISTQTTETESRARHDEIAARAMADFRRLYAGRRIRAWDVVCSDDADLVDMGVNVVIEIGNDTDGMARWTDEEHMDPWFFVSFVDGCLRPGWHVVAVRGPSYHLDGTVEAPTGWQVIGADAAHGVVADEVAGSRRRIR